MGVALTDAARPRRGNLRFGHSGRMLLRNYVSQPAQRSAAPMTIG